MARCPLMQIERHILRDWPRGKIIGIEVENARLGAIGRASLIGTARLKLLAEGFIGADFERRFGCQRKQCTNLPVYHFLNAVIFLGHPLAAGRVEFGIGADIVEELVQRAVKAHPFGDLFHLAANARNFGQADIMNLVSGERQRRRIAHQLGIELRPALHLAKPNAIARHTHIFIAQKIAQAGVGCINTVDRGFITCGDPRLILNAETVRHRLDRPPIGAFLARCGELRIELLDHVFDRQLGLENARRRALTEAANRAVHNHAILVVARDCVLVIFDRLERRGALPAFKGRIECVQAEEVVDGPRALDRQKRRREAGERLFLIAFEHIVGKLARRIESAAINRGDFIEVFLRETANLFLGLVGVKIANLVGIIKNTAEHRTDWAERQFFFVCAFEYRKHLVLLAHHRSFGFSNCCGSLCGG